MRIAAWWKTTSTPSISSRTSARSRMSPSTSVDVAVGARPVEVLAPAADEVVEDDDLVRAGEHELVGHVGADRAAAAGDEDSCRYRSQSLLDLHRSRNSTGAARRSSAPYGGDAPQTTASPNASARARRRRRGRSTASGRDDHQPQEVAERKRSVERQRARPGRSACRRTGGASGRAARPSPGRLLSPSWWVIVITRQVPHVPALRAGSAGTSRSPRRRGRTARRAGRPAPTASRRAHQERADEPVGGALLVRSASKSVSSSWRRRASRATPPVPSASPSPRAGRREAADRGEQRRRRWRAGGRSRRPPRGARRARPRGRRTCRRSISTSGFSSST